MYGYVIFAYDQWITPEYSVCLCLFKALLLGQREAISIEAKSSQR